MLPVAFSLVLKIYYESNQKKKSFQFHVENILSAVQWIIGRHNSKIRLYSRLYVLLSKSKFNFKKFNIHPRLGPLGYPIALPTWTFERGLALQMATSTSSLVIQGKLPLEENFASHRSMPYQTQWWANYTYLGLIEDSKNQHEGDDFNPYEGTYA